MIARFLRAVGEHFLWRDAYTGRWYESFWVAWWPIAGSVGLDGPQVAWLKRTGLWAGLRDWTRGRHWDRRSRYGLR
ncbi:MAG TPA: hypothetical protein VMW24_08400 [Sedimentisphaerales bacterium]|nr:hypothetical protein [Sedimentisphaerales bacterium]